MPAEQFLDDPRIARGCHSLCQDGIAEWKEGSILRGWRDLSVCTVSGVGAGLGLKVLAIIGWIPYFAATWGRESDRHGLARTG